MVAQCMFIIIASHAADKESSYMNNLLQSYRGCICDTSPSSLLPMARNTALMNVKVLMSMAS